MTVWLLVLMLTLPDGRYELHTSVYRTEAACEAAAGPKLTALEHDRRGGEVQLGDKHCVEEMVS